MTISFLKIPKDGINFSLKKEEISFTGHAVKLRDKVVKCMGKIQGNLPHLCDRCADDLILPLNEEILVFANDGLVNLQKETLENSIEFFDGFIDFDEIFTSELEAIKSDYFYCENCK